jgi:hypothetical protein
MIDKVLHKLFKSSCLMADPIDRKRDPNSTCRRCGTSPEPMKSLFDQSILTANPVYLVEVARRDRRQRHARSARSCSLQLTISLLVKEMTVAGV